MRFHRHHSRIACLLACLAAFSPLACIEHEIREVRDLAAIAQHLPAPLLPDSQDRNESGCMCRGATLCEIATADACLPQPCEILVPDVGLSLWQPPLIEAETPTFLAIEPPPPLYGKTLRAHCASWLL